MVTHYAAPVAAFGVDVRLPEDRQDARGDEREMGFHAALYAAGAERDRLRQVRQVESSCGRTSSLSPRFSALARFEELRRIFASSSAARARTAHTSAIPHERCAQTRREIADTGELPSRADQPCHLAGLIKLMAASFVRQRGETALRARRRTASGPHRWNTVTRLAPPSRKLHQVPSSVSAAAFRTPGRARLTLSGVRRSRALLGCGGHGERFMNAITGNVRSFQEPVGAATVARFWTQQRKP